MTATIRERVAGTTIDPRTLLSTDYFNHFNEVIMFLGMLPDMPEMLADIDMWTFKSYREHFQQSSLDFAPLAIESYDAADPAVRSKFDAIALGLSCLVVVVRLMLHDAHNAGETEKFKDLAQTYSLRLQELIDYGGAIVHGYGAVSDQSAVDKLF